MSDQKDKVVEGQSDRLDQATTVHLFYLGGLLVEGLKNFHEDLTKNYKQAHEVLGRLSYIRVTELTSKFETAALLVGDKAV